MNQRRMIEVALTAATIAAAVALPVGTASAATGSPQVHTVLYEGWFSVYEDCTNQGSVLMFTSSSTGYDCNPVAGGWELLSYWD